MEVIKYLDRIKFSNTIRLDSDTLKNLHRNHLYNISFENLNIHHSKKIILDENYLSDKIFNQKRGGYCYELNGMFFLLLKELGFNAKMISAQGNNGKGGWGEEFDHLAIIVELDELWLADVGFGDSFIEPITVTLDKPQKNLNGWFKISQNKEDEYLKMSKSIDNTVYDDEYIFTLKERTWGEFEGMNNYHQTSLDSHFTRGRVCSIAKEGGRVSLTNKTLIITKGKERKIVDVIDEKDFVEKLFEHFRIELKLALDNS